MKKIIVWAITVTALAGLGFACYRFDNIRQKLFAEKTVQLKELQETLIPLRFRISSRTDDSMVVEFQFYSLAVDNIDTVDSIADIAVGKEIGPLWTEELQGSELFIDCIKFQNNTFLPVDPATLWVFPYRIFTDAIPPDEGIIITDRYDDSGFPAVFNSFNLDAKDRERLSEVYADIQSSGTITDSTLQNAVSGNALHDMQQIARFRSGRWYDLVIHVKKGSLEVIAE